MVGCSILGCKSRSERKMDGITFHSYPLDTESKRKWVDVTGRINWQPTKFSKICSLHFNDDAFVFKTKTVHLKPNSLPKRNIHIEISKDSGATSYQEDILMMQPSTSKTDHSRIMCAAEQDVNKRTIDKTLQELQNIPSKKPCLATSRDDDDDVLPAPQQRLVSTPRKERHLKKLLLNEKKKSSKRLKKLRAVRESKRRLLKKTAHIENIIAELKCKMKIKSDELDLLSNIDTENADFLKRFIDKENRPRKYSASLRKFALCLHFISPNAYGFVRKQFNTCLPHPKTLYRWYKCIDCQPGFTNESFEAIKLLAGKSSKKILCCVSLDEMSIRQHLQWDGKQTVGYVNVGDNLDTDNRLLAKDALVFMVTSLNV